jgi:hypothetical protein
LVVGGVGVKDQIDALYKGVCISWLPQFYVEKLSAVVAIIVKRVASIIFRPVNFLIAETSHSGTRRILSEWDCYKLILEFGAFNLYCCARHRSTAASCTVLYEIRQENAGRSMYLIKIDATPGLN